MRLEREVSDYGYGWSVTLIVRGKHRVRWCSTRSTTRMWPCLVRGADENCNRAWTFVMWPLGSLDIWWEPHWRPEGSGICDKCKTELAAEGIYE